MAGAQAALGRLFSPGEPHAMVLSYALFERRFQSDPRVIGRTMAVNGYPFAVTGVLAVGFRFRFVFPQQIASGDEVRDMDAYIPFPDAVMRLPESSAVGAIYRPRRRPVHHFVNRAT